MKKMIWIFDIKHKIYRILGKTMGLSLTHNFDGKLFTLVRKGTGLSKAESARYAMMLQKEGNDTRTLKTRIAKWCIYVNCSERDTDK